MNHLKKYISVIVILFSVTEAFGQQTLQLSQYVFNGLAVNPAYAGYKEDWTINLSSRLQWTGMEGAPKTSAVSVDGLTNQTNKNVGLGFLVGNDRLGPENNSSFYMNYAYRLRLDDEDTQRLCFGIGAGLTQYKVDGTQFNATDPDDNLISGISQSKLTPDFRLGVYYYSSKVYVGASMLNLMPVNGTNSNMVINLNRSLYLTAGMLVPVSTGIDWKPSVMFKEDFKGPTNMDITNFLLFNGKFWVGASYSTGVTLYNKSNLQNGLAKTDAIAGIMQMNMTEHLRFGYSYDFATSKLAGQQGGSHEISLSLTLARKRAVVLSPRYF
jgi:type IX secretion system PorP/SprF family membrane protein